MIAEIWLKGTSQPLTYNNARNVYEKCGCIAVCYINEGRKEYVMFPHSDIFMVKQKFCIPAGDEITGENMQ